MYRKMGGTEDFVKITELESGRHETCFIFYVEHRFLSGEGSYERKGGREGNNEKRGGWQNMS